MSRASLSFAVLLTLYIFMGVRFEEHSLIAKYGADYRQYKQEVPGLIPNPFRKG